MTARLTGIDHIHVYVPDRAAAAAWFAQVLGFHIVESLRFWATAGGPLTIEDASGSIHLALFEKEHPTPSTAIAFGADSRNFLAWKRDLEQQGLLLRCSDHQVAWSLYFCDPNQNSYEITCYDYAAIAQALQASSLRDPATN